MDTDRDGFVSLEEFTMYFAKMCKDIDDEAFNNAIEHYLTFRRSDPRKLV